MAAGLIGEHRRISSILARAVTDFWYIAEAAVKKEKCDAKCLTKEQYNRSTSKSEVVPMDIPVSKEVKSFEVYQFMSLCKSSIRDSY